MLQNKTPTSAPENQPIPEDVAINATDVINESAAFNLTDTSFAAMAGVLLSRASGVLRTMVVNATFGATTAMDAFNAAFRFPNSLRDLFADGALSAAFITALVEAKQQGIDEERKLIAIVIGFFSFLTVTLAILAAIYAPPLMDVVTDEKFRANGGLPVAVLLFRLLVFYLPLTMLNAVVMAILGVLGQSFRAMNGSIFLSLGMICGALIFAPLLQHEGYIRILGLAIGAMIGAILQMAYQIRPLFKLKLIPTPNFNPRDWLTYQPLRKIIAQMTPRALGQGAMIMTLAINTFFATQIGTGVLTYIVTTVIIIQVPIGLFGVATGFAALPMLSSTLHNKNTKQFSELLVEGLRTAFWLASFTTFCIAILIVPFYVLLFQHGKITPYDTIQNSIAICAYATAIILASGSKILVNTLYTLNATRQIIYNAFVYLFVNTTLNFLLIPFLGIIGLGISFGIATTVDFWLNYLVVAKNFRKKGYGDNPYFTGGQHFTSKIVILSVSGLVIGLLGVWLTQNVWAHFNSLFNFNLNVWLALLILILGGCLFISIFCILIYKWGPSHLKRIFKR